MELRRPKIEKLEWQDAEGNSINKAVVGETIKLYAEVTEFEEGQGVTFTVYNSRTQAEVTGIGAEVKDGKAEAQWTYHWDGEPLEEKPKYYFEVTANRCKPVKSEDIELGANYRFILVDGNGKVLSDTDCKVTAADGAEQTVKSDSEGYVSVEDIVPGSIQVIPIKKEKNDG